MQRVQGSTSIMRVQLRHLTASKPPDITIRVLPFGVSDRITVASALLRLREQDLSTVYLEDLFGATYLKEPEWRALLRTLR